MAYDISKLTKLSHLKSLAQKVKSETDALSNRIDALVTAGGEPNVLEKVKVNGVDLEIVQKAVDILIAQGSANGTIAVNGTDVAVKGLQALAYKSEVSEDELATALKTLINSKAAASDLTTLDGKVTTLIGSDSGKSARAIAAEEIAAQLIPAQADESLDTLQEIAAWIQSHPDDAATINSKISALETLTAGFDAGTTIKGYIDSKVGTGSDLSTAIAGLQSRMTTAEGDIDAVEGRLDTAEDDIDAVEGRVGTLETDNTTNKSDISGLKSAVQALQAIGATKVEASTINGNIKIDNVETTVYTLPSDVLTTSNVASDAEVTEMLTEVFGGNS